MLGEMDLNTASYLVIGSMVFTGMGLTAKAEGTDWRIAFGGHNTIVEQVDSHTLGAHAGFFVEHVTESDISWKGNIDIFIDDDKDKLDPDHIPIWFQTAWSVDGNLYRFSPTMNLQWQVTLDGKRNTVSSVEKQSKLFPAIVARFDNQKFYAGLTLGGGHYMLEIDDDVPRERGYDREDFQNKTGAYTVAADTQIMLGESFDIYAGAQTWNDGSDWLENKYSAVFSYHSDSWIEDSEVKLSIEHSEYNLDPFDNRDKNDADYLAILPWDNDTLVRIYVDMPWG